MFETFYLPSWHSVTCNSNFACDAITGEMASQVRFDQFQCLQGMLAAGVHHHEAQLDCLFFPRCTGKHGLQQQMTATGLSFLSASHR